MRFDKSTVTGESKMEFTKKLFIASIVFSIVMMAVGGFCHLVLDAAIREQEFNDNIRAARCERMNEHDRAYMRGYCRDISKR